MPLSVADERFFTASPLLVLKPRFRKASDRKLVEILRSGKCKANIRRSCEWKTCSRGETIEQGQSYVQAKLLTCDAVNDPFKHRRKPGWFKPHEAL